MDTETTPVPTLGAHPTNEDLATTHAHPPRFSEEGYALNGGGFVQRICVGGCSINAAADHHPCVETTHAP